MPKPTPPPQEKDSKKTRNKDLDNLLESNEQPIPKQHKQKEPTHEEEAEKSGGEEEVKWITEEDLYEDAPKEDSNPNK